MSYAGKPYLPPGPIAPTQDANNSLGTISLVLGILSVFMGCPLAIGALITGWIGMKREPSGMARAGFVIGLIMTIVNVVAGIVGLLFFVFVIGIAAYAESQERATVDYSRYPTPSYPNSSHSRPSEFGSSPDIAPFPVSMPPIEMPEMPKMPESYVPPAMPPGMDPSAFPRSPGFGAPPRFEPPGGMGRGPGFPPGAFPPGALPPGAYPPGAYPPDLGAPTTMETLTPTSDDFGP
ncbi:MAG TPA: DUF4190 domain-containing protein [Pirellulaceae bacterium]|jgi:hypothetical protein|nr:DUF4190 domain-containing protein [Pirellulaceae bacterium]